MYYFSVILSLSEEDTGLNIENVVLEMIKTFKYLKLKSENLK